MNRRLKLVAAPVVSQSEPDSGVPRSRGSTFPNRARILHS
jgi:hypothetical protein